ncbi:hypothetical protein V8G56_06225 [Gaetbulibacter aquiaggeris]|uniref:Uncharacterized protein n=1 Tax=Gaetbulibacter aquiaggeris TaxID=1735373 RepID=A0ABW7MND6_9FLAO
MKLNFYILLILLLSFSVANAQESSTELINNVNISVSEIIIEVSTTQTNETTVNENKELNTNDVIARDSDIRIYLNQKRNVQNINLLFPEFNKDQVA